MKNTMWHVALEPEETRMQDVIVIDLEFYDTEYLSRFLGTQHIKAKDIEMDDGGYLLMYGGEFERPYPSIMIWRYEKKGDANVIADMRIEDSWVLEVIWRYWLMPEDSGEEFTPPEAFLMLEKED